MQALTIVYLSVINQDLARFDALSARMDNLCLWWQLQERHVIDA